MSFVALAIIVLAALFAEWDVVDRVGRPFVTQSDAATSYRGSTSSGFEMPGSEVRLCAAALSAIAAAARLVDRLSRSRALPMMMFVGFVASGVDALGFVVRDRPGMLIYVDERPFAYGASYGPSIALAAATAGAVLCPILFFCARNRHATRE
jgi:hypothetical protein